MPSPPQKKRISADKEASSSHLNARCECFSGIWQSATTIVMVRVATNTNGCGTAGAAPCADAIDCGSAAFAADTADTSVAQQAPKRSRVGSIWFKLMCYMCNISVRRKSVIGAAMCSISVYSSCMDRCFLSPQCSCSLVVSVS